MQQILFGSQALPGPAGGTYIAPQTPYLDKGEPTSEGRGMGREWMEWEGKR